MHPHLLIRARAPLLAQGEDGGSMKIAGGCNPSACTPSYPWKCSWHGNATLGDMMLYQQTRKRGGGYNEVLVSGHNWPLPHMIEAFFEARPNDMFVRGVHADFLASYGLPAADYPLLRLIGPEHAAETGYFALAA